MDSLLDGSALELVRKASAEGQQLSNTDLGTPEKLQRGLSNSYLLLGCGDLGSFFLSWNNDSWTDQSECWWLKLKQLKLNAGLCHTLSNVLQKGRRTEATSLVLHCCPSASLQLHGKEKPEFRQNIYSFRPLLSSNSLLIILLRKQTSAAWDICSVIPFTEFWSFFKI